MSPYCAIPNRSPRAAPWPIQVRHALRPPRISDFGGPALDLFDRIKCRTRRGMHVHEVRYSKAAPGCKRRVCGPV
jgi:hypothetical protein